MAINKISGVSTVGGGSYDELIMDGVITCNGDIHAQSAKIDGVVTVNGMVEAKENIVLGGVLTVTGRVKGADIRVDGVCTAILRSGMRFLNGAMSCVRLK
jgi:cytoskeletal protein CcmA (bactofilin family)